MNLQVRATHPKPHTVGGLIGKVGFLVRVSQVIIPMHDHDDDDEPMPMPLAAANANDNDNHSEPNIP